jgi:fructokinase
MKKVFCVGELLIDFVGQGGHPSLSKTDQFLKKAGGAPANVAAAVSRLGSQAYFVGAVGKDPFGNFLIETLSQEGVALHFLQQVPTFTTLAFVNLGADGERDFVFSRGADRELNYDPSLSDQLTNQIVHFGAATSFLGGNLENTYSRYLDEAIVKGALISFDPNYRHDLHRFDIEDFIQKSLHFISKAHLIKLSEEEAKLIANSNHLEEACRFLHKQTSATICITLGKEGTLLSLDTEHQIKVPTIPIKAIDTTGSGDAFIGCLLATLSKSDSTDNLKDESWMTKAVNMANKAGAFTAQNYGAIAALPKEKDLL